MNQKHNAIAEQYYKELEQAQANATIYHYSLGVSEKPDIAFIKSWLKKKGCKSFSDYLNYESMF